MKNRIYYFSCKPQKGLFKVVIRFGWDIIVLQILFSVKHNAICFDFSILDIDLVSSEYNWDIFADPHQITMPIWNVFVSDTWRHVEHNDSALSLNIYYVLITLRKTCETSKITLNVIAITESSEFFLTSGIPNVKSKGASVCVKN